MTKRPSLSRGLALAMATPADLPEVQACLQRGGLPHEDVAPHLPDFCVARDAGRLVGTVGLEHPGGSSGLLRSLSVDSGYQGRGLGSMLCDLIEAHARHVGVTHLYLLTTTAQAFFERRGYMLESRDNAPDGIRQTAEFNWRGCASAAFMSRTLPGGGLHLPAALLPLRQDVPGARMWAVGLSQAMLTYFEVDAHTRFETHSHPGEQITTVVEGELFFEFGERLVRAVAGDVVAIPAGVPHAAFTRETAVRAFDAWSPPRDSNRSA